MAVRNYNNVQGLDRRGAVYTHKRGKGDQTPDITEFLIEVLDAQTGTIKETLTLQGTHLPFQPFVHPVRQEVVPYYYPGGQANRTPTLQVLGSVDEPITLRGWFRASKIQDVSRRTEPLEISNILERLIREGNACRFTLGSWSKYGVLIEFRPEYRTDAWVDWSLTIQVIGDKNPITGDEVEGDDPVSRVFGTDAGDDFGQVANTLAQELVETKNELENTGYLPKYAVQPFSVSGYLSSLIEGTAVGEIVYFGEVVYNSWREIISSVDLVTTSIVNFSEQVERTAENIQDEIQRVVGQISKIYRIQENLYNAVSIIGAEVDTFSRLLAWNTIGNMITYTHTLQGHYQDMKKSLEREEVRTFREIYFTKPGDTLQRVSTKFFGSVDRWEEIARINQIPFDDLTLIEDTLLVIPN